MLGALQQGFCWGLILLSGWACIATFCMTEFDNIMRISAGVCFLCV
jgi:hypothetical protein